MSTAGPRCLFFLLPVILSKGHLPLTIGKPLYYLYFLKRRKPAAKENMPLKLTLCATVPAGTICPAFLFEQPLVCG